MKIAFVGFRHGHIYSLYDMALQSPDVEITACIEENAAARTAAEAGVPDSAEDVLRGVKQGTVTSYLTSVSARSGISLPREDSGAECRQVQDRALWSLGGPNRGG